MNLLLDNQAFLWGDSNAAKLSTGAVAAINDPANTSWLSVVSIWELIIKVQIGKLTLRSPLSQIIAENQAKGLNILSVILADTLAVESLPLIHKDPFDRLLAAQCIAEDMELVTADPIFAQYPVRVLW